MVPLVWLLFIGFIAVLLIYGDVSAKQSMYVPPEKAAALQYNKWPVWREIELPEERIRMLWIIHDYVPFVNAGSEICAHTINRFLMSKPYKYDVWVASPGYPQRTYDGIRCFDLYDTQKLFEVLKTTKVIHSHSYLYRNHMLWISRILGIPFVEWVHTDNYVRSIDAKNWFDTRITGRQWTVFNSESLKKSAPKLPDEFTKIVLPIVDYRVYAIDNEKKKPKYVTLSNVNDNKGGMLLIQLAKALPEMEFQGILGGYRKQIVANGIPNLRYIQHTPEIKEVYAQTWVQIMPSNEETWGRTAVEAMSSGIPLIVSPTPGLKECCKEAAIYCDRGDLDSWVVTLRKLREDKEYYNQRSAIALERARALDPNPEYSALEEWLDTKVIPSGVNGRNPTWLEKNMLFR
jgi:glycosyltransferase involved in cell wall biosynthesis